MKAAVFVEVGKPLQICELPQPDPGPGEIVLKVHRCGICATDLHMTSGSAIDFPTGSVLGHEIGAEIVAVGRDVDWFKVGDAVVPMSTRGCGTCPECLMGRTLMCSAMGLNVGGYAEYMLSSARSCARVPRSLSLNDAALVEPLAVGLHGVGMAPVRPGDRVLVLGAGPIGLAATFWAERSGASRVVVAAPSTRRKDIALAMGCSDFVLMGDGLAERTAEALGGAPDVVLECVGAPGLFATSIDMVKPMGTVVILGLCTHHDHFMPATALFKEVKIQFALATHLRQFDAAINALSAGDVRPRAMVTDTISLDQLPENFEALRHRSLQCKVLVAPFA